MASCSGSFEIQEDTDLAAAYGADKTLPRFNRPNDRAALLAA